MRIGFAKGEISPGQDCSLVGYDFRLAKFGPGNDGVLDPLFARAIALIDSNNCPFLLIALDLCVLESAIATGLRHAIGAACQMDAERVLLVCSHTHSGPYPEDLSSATDCPRTPQLNGLEPDPANGRYLGWLRKRLVQLAHKAIGLTEPVVALRKVEFLAEFGYKRRVMMPEGMRLCWNVHEWPELEPGRNPDPVVSGLLLRGESGREFLIWSAGVHPVCLGKTSNLVSADWPGAANRLLAQWNANLEPVYLHGAAGEIHPWLATQARPEAVELVARAVAAPLDLALRAARPVALPQTVSAIPLPRFAAISLPGLPQGPKASVLLFGSVALVFLPLELFAALAVKLRAAFTGTILISSVSNGWEGYWPDRIAFAEGGYEVNAAIARGRKAADGGQLIRDLIALLRDSGFA